MPQLATSTPLWNQSDQFDADFVDTPCFFCSGIVVWNHGNVLDVSFPSLRNTTDLTLAGNLGT